MYHYVHGGQVPSRILGRIHLLEEIMGGEGIKWLVDEGQSPALYDEARRLGRYLMDERSERMKEIVHWMVDTNGTYRVRRAVKDGIQASIIDEAIKTKRPLKMQGGAWGLG